MPKTCTNSQKPTDEAYILEFEGGDAMNGVNRLVDWYRGRGVLDRRAVADVRPDLVDAQTFEMKVGWDVLAETANYWSKRGANVTKVDAAEADEYRAKLDRARAGGADSSPAPEGEQIPVGELAKEFGLKVRETVEALAAGGVQADNGKTLVDAERARLILAGPELATVSALLELEQLEGLELEDVLEILTEAGFEVEGGDSEVERGEALAAIAEHLAEVAATGDGDGDGDGSTPPHEEG